MNKEELRQLAEDRVLDAQALLAGGRWSFAYYVSGYAIECGLKASILARMGLTGWIFEPKVKIDEVITHDFTKLLTIAGLKAEHDAALATSAAAGTNFVGNWGIVSSWNVSSPYAPHTEAEARELHRAVTEADGVLPWIRNYW